MAGLPDSLPGVAVWDELKVILVRLRCLTAEGFEGEAHRQSRAVAASEACFGS